MHFDVSLSPAIQKSFFLHIVNPVYTLKAGLSDTVACYCPGGKGAAKKTLCSSLMLLVTARL